MKQYITQDQYEELTDAERQKFVEWTLSNGDHAVTYRSIGHLIWFLDEHIESGWLNVERAGGKEGWRVQHKYIDFDSEDVPELVDALWTAVKVVLMHTFAIVCVDGITIMFCSQCGKSYKLATYGYGGETKAWKELAFKNDEDQKIEPPSGDCKPVPTESEQPA